MKAFRFLPAMLLACVCFSGASAADKLPVEQVTPRKIVLIAGPITGHPKDAHEYEKNIILLKHLLDNSPSLQGRLKVEVHFNGWPADEKTLDDADTILITSDGCDRRLEDHPFYIGDRMTALEKQMKRGCGLVQFHWSTFNPVSAHDKITQWVGGYFDYETGTAANKWRSAITTRGDWQVQPSKDHPIASGVNPFKLKEEFYHHIRFGDNDPRLTAITTIGKSDKNEWTVGWAVQREDGGRGFGFTGGHFYENWWNDDFRKLILNAIVWTAKADVPALGIESKMDKRFRALILTGHNHPAHDWSSVTAALIGVIEQDPFAIVHVTENPEDMATDKLKQYDLLVLNYCNWDRPGISDEAKKGFNDYIAGGGGLAVIHFANGAFNATLPAKDSEWADFRKTVRRVWMHGEGRSGHDSFGAFKVDITSVKHPITAGLSAFDTLDELYFKQEGDVTIEPLAMAKSKVTGKDEPMAWAFEQGKGRVFQTVLGHDARSIRGAGALIRRGCVWAAGRENISFDPPAAVTEKMIFRSGSQWKPKVVGDVGTMKEGTGDAAVIDATPRAATLDKAFGKSLVSGAVLDGNQKYIEPPITVECWARATGKGGFNILVASETKASPTHWEIYTYAGTGAISAYLPGTQEGEIKSNVNICDGTWHHLAMIYEAKRVRLFVDGKLVKDQIITRRGGKSLGDGLAFGRLVEGSIGLDGAVDDVHIRSGVHEIMAIPSAPAKKGEQTVGLWDFESALAPRAVTAAAVDAKPQAAEMDAQPWRQKEADWVDDRWSRTDLGPFFGCSMRTPGGDVMRAIAIRVGDLNEGAMAFDSTDCVIRGGWLGGFLKMNPARYGLIRWPEMDGKKYFATPKNTSWKTNLQGNAKVQYKGLTVRLGQIILSYRIGDVQVYESPSLESNPDARMMVRTFEFGPRPQGSELSLVIAEGDLDVKELTGSRDIKLTRDQGWWTMKITGQLPVTAKITVAAHDAKEEAYQKLLASSPAAGKLSVIWYEAPQLETKPVMTKGHRAADSGPYVVDTITVPFENPSNSLFFTSGVDFLNDGTAAVCTVHGEVWLVSGIDDKLDKITWRRFATGLYQPLGLKVINNEIHVLCRDRIVKLKSSGKTFAAHEYESVALIPTATSGGHDYTACLETDAQGNLYYVDPKGVHRFTGSDMKHETLATGFRNPIAMSVGPQGDVTVSPQEGTWTPASMICLIKAGESGKYFGFGGPRVTQDRPLGYDQPLMFIPHYVDNSTGGQVWVTSDKWGPLKGQLLNLSFGMSTAHLVLRDESGPQSQGLLLPLKIRCSSGIMRGRFSPHDGQLYVTGMRGWQTNAVHDGCLQRIRYTGKNLLLPVAWKAEKGAIVLTFDQPLDRELTEDPEGYSLEQWNYQYTGNYGSKDYSVNKPGVEGHDAVTIKDAKLSADGKTLRLIIPDLKPVMQFKLKYDLESVAGETMRGEAYGTIHEIK